ncbi:MAG: hypothetical protein CM15mP106_3800 [Candidatus Neomarinimicrobiota bacterium]|nr:MAG: hypothetical protein CM15mP106_3800 [Candidatus Neomarinimicrobiota bacterium]
MAVKAASFQNMVLHPPGFNYSFVNGTIYCIPSAIGYSWFVKNWHKKCAVFVAIKGYALATSFFRILYV